MDWHQVCQPVVKCLLERFGCAGESPEGFVETTDYIEMNGIRICKPFVEKPVSGDNHNINIYYPQQMVCP